MGAAAAALLLWVVRQRVAANAGARGASSAAGGRGVPQAAGASARQAASASSAGTKAGGFLRVAGFELLAGLLFTAVSYLCGWAQFMAVAGVGPEAIAPFVVIDVLKVVAAVLCARAVRAAVR